MQDSLRNKVENALEEIRPFLLSDGGDIVLVDIPSKDTVYVKLEGNCVHCTVNQMTFKTGVIATIQKHVPEIQHVIEVNNAV